MARHVDEGHPEPDPRNETATYDSRSGGAHAEGAPTHEQTGAQPVAPAHQQTGAQPLPPTHQQTGARPVAHTHEATGATSGSQSTERVHAHEEAIREDRAHREGAARDKFGGLNWGACFFGWLVAIALSILLTSIIGAIATAVGANAEISQYDAKSEAATIGVAAAIVLLVVLLIGYYAGGYVAGRMSRFDGGRQGLGVWVIGLLVTILAVILGAVFGSEYNILERVQLPSIPVSGDDLGLGAIITAVAVVLGTLLAAMAGGKMGHRYHNRVDRIVRD